MKNKFYYKDGTTSSEYDNWQEVLGTIDEQDCQYWLDGKEVKKEDVIKAPKWVSPY